MTAFDAALATLHENADLSVEAVYQRAGAADALPAFRVIRSEPESVEQAFGARLIAGAPLLHIRIADLPDRPVKGDTVTIGAEVLTVRDGQMDAGRLTWVVTYDGG